MAKTRNASLSVEQDFGSPAPRPFVIEVKGGSGRWCPQTSSESEDPAHVRAVMKAQGSEWMMDKREWRTVAK